MCEPIRIVVEQAPRPMRVRDWLAAAAVAAVAWWTVGR
jgi:hypothetical protein